MEGSGAGGDAPRNTNTLRNRIHATWFITDTSNLRVVCPLEFPYTVHATSLIYPVRWTICVRYSVSVINHTGCIGGMLVQDHGMEASMTLAKK